jgi:hypothetical protein
MKKPITKILRAASLVTLPALLLGMMVGTAHGQILVAGNGGMIGEYTTSGATVNPSLISGFNYPVSMAISGNNLFVLNYYDGTIGKYNLDGTVVNASLISGLGVYNSQDIAISGERLYVANEYTGTIGEYTTDGTIVNASLINTLMSAGQQPFAIVVVPEPSPSLLLAMGSVLLLGWCRVHSQRL